MNESRWPQGLLVSVRDADEAELAVTAGAAIIDVKEPTHGSLGRADVAVAAAVIAQVAGRAPVTLAGGELAAGPDQIVAHLAELRGLLPARVPPPMAVKAGPAGLTAVAWRDSFARLRDGLPSGMEAVAVAYADWQRAGAAAPEAIIDAAAPAGAVTVLVDTFDKQGPGLLETVRPESLAHWNAAATAAGLTLAVAGRLTPAGVAAAFAVGVRVVGVRSAACGGGRDGRVAARRVRELVTLSRVVAPDRDRCSSGGCLS
jgi:uncharacterized protein (UPF0264 family)